MIGSQWPLTIQAIVSDAAESPLIEVILVGCVIEVRGIRSVELASIPIAQLTVIAGLAAISAIPEEKHLSTYLLTYLVHARRSRVEITVFELFHLVARHIRGRIA